VLRKLYEHFVMRRLERAFETGRILRYLIVTITAVAVVFGTLMWIVDRDNFPTLGLALWWAVSTVTTVGYGDVVPDEPAGRALASALMIFGYASLSLLTGIVASTLVSRAGAASTGELVVRLENRLAEVERLLREQQR
jgi:voltage-gated potassium channel Kch